jgi:ubiquinone/menaquinone biosynthesis C-methylase UbiE
MEIRADTPPSESSAVRKPPLTARILLILLRTAYHLLYNELAFTYDSVAWIVSFGEWAAWRRCAIPSLRPGSVLEIGHGTATLSLEMSAAGFPVTAIDRSPAMGRIALSRRRKEQKRKGKNNLPAFVRADAQRLPFRSGSFVNAVSTFPAEFILKSTAIREIARCLSPGGRLVIIPTALPEFLAGRYLGDAETGIAQFLGSLLQREGFQTRTEILRRARSRVLMIVADKSAGFRP